MNQPAESSNRGMKRSSHSDKRADITPALFGMMALLLASCSSLNTYQAYPGDGRGELQVAVLIGEQYRRQDWLNRYVDGVRFTSVDGQPIPETQRYSRVAVEPGFHDIEVYFYWDLGSQRGLPQALVRYAAGQETLSRTLRFNARPGERYLVRAEPVFEGERRDITTLTHVNFWVENDEGFEIVSREQGSFQTDE